VTGSPRVAVAGCFHETNTFATTPTDHDAFVVRGRWLAGGALADAFAGTRTVVGGFLDAAAPAGLSIVPVFGAYATPAGTVTREAFAAILERLVEGVRAAGPLDGLLLELHGAMVVQGSDDPETDLVQAVREAVGDGAVVAVTDLHANMTAERVGLLDGLVGYRTNPHVDTYECGLDAAGHLDRLLRGELTTALSHRRVPVVAAPIAQATADPPLSRLMARAGELQRRHGLVNVTVHGGYAYADVPHAGLSFTVTAPAGAEAAAAATLDSLADLALAHRDEFAVALPDAEEAVRLALDHVRRRGGPVAVADTGDNINGGAPGDSTWLLHALLEQGTGRVAATLWDPEAVAAAEDVGVGGTLRAPLGGKAEALGGRPVEAPATVRRLGEGTFRNTGPMARGAHVRMGPTAVVSLARIDVVLQSLPVQPNDPELLRSVGLDPTGYDLVILKGAAALRAGWRPLVREFVDAGTRGVTDCDLRRLPYRRLRDAWPLSEAQARPARHTGPAW
jgi:microcystin degradation protein MlrC